MITLITGQPGAGKTLYAVSMLLHKMVQSDIVIDGVSQKRTIYTNIKGLLIEHVFIDSSDLMNWPEWVKMTDILCFDEVQEVWRPRGSSVTPPPAIQALEIHRSKYAIDCIFLTQHPMLLDQNVRRLVNRHLHVRRLANLPLAWVYEWDHCSNPSMVKSAITSGKWFYPRWAYKLYQSAPVHTHQPRSIPKPVYYLLAITFLGVFAFYPSLIPNDVRKLVGMSPNKPKDDVTITTTKGDPSGQLLKVKTEVLPVIEPANMAEHVPTQAVIPVYPLADLVSVPEPYKPYGCIRMAIRCVCYGASGEVIRVDVKQCISASTEIALIARSSFPQITTSQPSLSKLPGTNTDKSEASKESTAFHDSGFALPVGTPYEQHAKRYKSEPSGNLYPH